MHRGETIRRRRRMIMTATPTAALVAAVVAFVLIQDTDGGAGREVDQVAAGNAVLSVEPVVFDWTSQPAELGWVQRRVQTDGVMYTLSTAPGTRWEDFPDGNAPKAIYVSTDGLNWTANPVGGAWASALAVGDGVLYAVGTAPAARSEPPALVIGRSADHGTTLETRQLPLGVGENAFVSSNVIATSQGVLAVATGTTPTDPWTLLPPEALQGAVEPVPITDGIAVFPTEEIDEAYETCFGVDTAACRELVESRATYFSSWEDLGLDGEAVMMGAIVHNQAFWSTDGADFSPVEYPLPDTPIEGVFTVGEEAVVATGGRLLASVDAREWRPVGDGLPPPVSPLALGRVGDRVVAVTRPVDGTGGASVFGAPDLGGPWEEIPLRRHLGLTQAEGGQLQIGQPGAAGTFVWLSAATVSDGGVALHLAVDQSGTSQGNALTALARRIFGGGSGDDTAQAVPAGILLYSSDLVTWQAEDTSHLSAFIERLDMTPNGQLVAHASGLVDGRPQFLQYVTDP